MVRLRNLNGGRKHRDKAFFACRRSGACLMEVESGLTLPLSLSQIRDVAAKP
jgi:hypothetical protein